MMLDIAGQIALWVTVFVLAHIIISMWQDRDNYKLRFRVWRRHRRSLTIV